MRNTDMHGCFDTESLVPPAGYIKKIVNPESDCPLTVTFTEEQIEKRVAFYRELNDLRTKLPKHAPPVQKTLALHGWKRTTTVRVYMRETISRIASQLCNSDYSILVENVNDLDGEGRIDKDHGFMVLSVRATVPDLTALFTYIRPGASYYVYDGERSKYIPGDTAASEFIVTRPEDPLQPLRFWRRSQSFISRIEEIS
jgi:hypothetical protein